MTPFFSSTFSDLTVCNIHFWIWKYSKFIFMWSPFGPFWSVKYLHFLEYLLLFLYDNVDEEKQYFSNSKSSASGSVLLSFCLIFCQFQPGVAYTSVAYEKKCVFLVIDWFTNNHLLVQSQQCLKSVPQKRHQSSVVDVVVLSFLLILNIFYTIS